MLTKKSMILGLVGALSLLGGQSVFSMDEQPRNMWREISQAREESSGNGRRIFSMQEVDGYFNQAVDWCEHGNYAVQRAAFNFLGGIVKNVENINRRQVDAAFGLATFGCKSDILKLQNPIFTFLMLVVGKAAEIGISSDQVSVAFGLAKYACERYQNDQEILRSFLILLAQRAEYNSMTDEQVEQAFALVTTGCASAVAYEREEAICFLETVAGKATIEGKVQFLGQLKAMIANPPANLSENNKDRLRNLVATTYQEIKVTLGEIKAKKDKQSAILRQILNEKAENLAQIVRNTEKGILQMQIPCLIFSSALEDGQQ